MHKLTAKLRKAQLQKTQRTPDQIKFTSMNLAKLMFFSFMCRSIVYKLNITRCRLQTNRAFFWGLTWKVWKPPTCSPAEGTLKRLCRVGTVIYVILGVIQ